MSAKVIIVLCAQSLLVQIALSQCTSRAAVTADPGYIGGSTYGWGAYDIAGPALGLSYGYAEPAFGTPYGFAAPWGLGISGLDFTPTSGGALPVSSGSALPPTGISVISENVYEGPLAVVGELPFVGTVAMEGSLPTFGAGAINHACGNGVNAMASEITAFNPGYTGTYAPGFAGAYAPGFTGAYAPGMVGPAISYGGEWINRGCNCAF